MKYFAIALLLALALPALAGDKANPYQVSYGSYYGTDGGYFRIQNGMNVDINVVLVNMNLPSDERAKSYRVPAHNRVDTTMPYDVNNTSRYACVAPSIPRVSNEVGSEGWLCW